MEREYFLESNRLVGKFLCYDSLAENNLLSNSQNYHMILRELKILTVINIVRGNMNLKVHLLHMSGIRLFWCVCYMSPNPAKVGFLHWGS